MKQFKIFSDGAASQFKNIKCFANLIRLQTEFNISVSWHFFATSHGKTAGDGVGGNLKCVVRRASAQRTSGNQIRSAQDVFECASEKCKSVLCFLVSKQEIEGHHKNLEHRYKEIIVKNVKGTQGFHSFVPVSDTTITVKYTSSSVNSKDFKIF